VNLTPVDRKNNLAIVSGYSLAHWIICPVMVVMGMPANTENKLGVKNYTFPLSLIPLCNRERIVSRR